MKVSIGLPVRNGELFLKDAIDSILAQTYEDFELIISDNASTDRTREICESFTDSRIRYYHNEKNKGAAWNFNRVFELSNGEYFKWAAHDDILAPEFLHACVDVLEKDPSIILSFTRVKFIDKNGKFLKDFPLKLKVDAVNSVKRFSEVLLRLHAWIYVFGVIRSNLLKKTDLICSYFGSDNVLVAHLSLLGRFVQIPDSLFFYRRHSGQSIRLVKDPPAFTAWFDPNTKGKIFFPQWRYFIEYYKLVKAPLNFKERMECYFWLELWLLLHSPFLAIDLFRAARSVLKRGFK
ncbi:glycosyltransferase family 2 protein [Thermodesulfobacteriota bacterium]